MFTRSPQCLWSASQCLTTRVCGPWYGSPQLLRSNCYLPMDSLVGMSIEEVNIYTWHDLIHAVTISTTYCLKKCFLWPLYVLDHKLEYLWAFWSLINTVLMHNVFPCQWTLHECTMCDLPTLHSQEAWSKKKTNGRCNQMKWTYIHIWWLCRWYNLRARYNPLMKFLITVNICWQKKPFSNAVFINRLQDNQFSIRK